MALEIVINTDTCMGSGNCAFWAPAAFDLGEDGVAVVLDARAAPEEKILAAMAGCPTRSITVVIDGEPLKP